MTVGRYQRRNVLGAEVALCTDTPRVTTRAQPAVDGGNDPELTPVLADRRTAAGLPLPRFLRIRGKREPEVTGDAAPGLYARRDARPPSP